MAILSNINGKFRVDSAGAVYFGTSAGTNLQVLQSIGTGGSPTWVNVDDIIGGPYLPIAGGVLEGATSTDTGISFTVGGNLFVTGTSTLTGALSGTSATFSGNVTISQPTNGSDAILSLISKSASGNSRTSTIEYDADNEYMYFKNAGTTVATMTSGGNVGIGTVTPQKKVHIEGTGGASEMQILVSSASDTVGHTAGIGLRGEGGEADGDLRIKGGIFFERIAGSFGNGKMILAVNSSVSNTSVTVADHALTIDTNKNVGIGTTVTDEAKLIVEASTEIPTGGWYNEFGNLHVTTDTQGINNGGTISMGGLGRTAGPTEYFRYAQISGRAESGSNGTPQGYMAFETTSGVTNITTERMRIDSSGNVTKPTSCAFSVSTSVPGFTVGTTEVKIAYNTENVDTNGNYDTTNYRFTAPVTGNYLIGTTNTCYISTGVTVYMAIYIRKNGVGTSYRFRGGGVDNDVNDWFGMNGSVVIPLAEDDYIELWGYANSGSFQIVNTEGHFYGYLIG